MPILDVDEFKVHFLSQEGIAEDIPSTTNHSSPNASHVPTPRMRSIVFCLNECDALVAWQMLQAHKIYHTTNGIQQDVMFVTCVEDVYNFIDQHVQSKNQFPQLQLFQYQRVLLIGFGGHAFTDPKLYTELQAHFTGLLPTATEKERLQFWVFDFRRPAYILFEEETEPWFLIISTSEFEEWKRQKEKGDSSVKTPFATANPIHGLYFSTPISCLMNQIVWEVGISPEIYAKNNFLAATSLFWHYLQQYIDAQYYEDMIQKLKDDMAIQRYNCHPGDEFSLDTQYGTLPFLQYSCLQDALNSSEHLFVMSQDITENERDNDIRINCGVTKKELRSHQSEFRITNKENEVQRYLRETYGQSANTIDWARAEHPDLNNAALAHMTTFMLSFCKDNEAPYGPYIGNCRDFQEIVETLVNVNHSYDLKTEAYLLQNVMLASQAHTRELFEKIRSSKMEARKCGGETVWLFNFRSLKSTYLHPMQLRGIALLGSNYKARGDSSKRSSVILSFTRISDSQQAFIYAAKPSADKKHPDLWPAILRWLNKKGVLEANSIYPNIAVTRPDRLREVREQILDLYKQRHNPYIFSIDERKGSNHSYSDYESDEDRENKRMRRVYYQEESDDWMQPDALSAEENDDAKSSGTEKSMDSADNSDESIVNLDEE